MTWPTEEQSTVAIVVATIAGISGYATALLGRKPSTLVIQEQINASFKTLIEGYEERIDDLTAVVKSMKSEIATLNQHIEDLTQTLKDAGIKPPPRPAIKAVR